MRRSVPSRDHPRYPPHTRPMAAALYRARGHLRRAARRHPQLADAAIALAVFAAAMVTTFAGHRATGTGSQTVAVAAAAIGCGALGLRRPYPVPVLAVSAVAAEAFLHEASGTSGVLILLAPCVALYTVAERVERRRGLAIGGCVLAMLAGLHALTRMGMLGALGPQNLAFTALGGLAIAAGDSSRNRRAYLAEVEGRAARAEVERERDARRRVAEERLRIARDLHDSVGHHLALISVQSDVAARALDGDVASAREAMAHVKSASRKALEELRDTVSLLRQPGDPVAPTGIPAPGIDALDELVAELRRSGLAVDYHVRGAAMPLAPVASRTAYRVIQESLTNAYKHSAGRRALLALCYDLGELSITVDDLEGSGRSGELAKKPRSVPCPHPLLPTGQHGIAGMRERVLALGGRFTAGPRPEGGFRVAAALPYQPADLVREGVP